MLQLKVSSSFDGDSPNSTVSFLPQMRCVNITLLLLWAGLVAAYEVRSLVGLLPPPDSDIEVVLPGQAGYANASKPCTSLQLSSIYSR
jgi:hypothetical protein